MILQSPAVGVHVTRTDLWSLGTSSQGTGSSTLSVVVCGAGWLPRCLATVPFVSYRATKYLPSQLSGSVQSTVMFVSVENLSLRGLRETVTLAEASICTSAVAVAMVAVPCLSDAVTVSEETLHPCRVRVLLWDVLPEGMDTVVPAVPHPVAEAYGVVVGTRVLCCRSSMR